MRTEDCRAWREDIGALVLGHLDDERERTLGAHLESCAECRTEAEELGRVAALLTTVDPQVVMAMPAAPPCASAVSLERRPRRRTARFVAAAAVLAVLAGGLVVGLARHER